MAAAHHLHRPPPAPPLRNISAPPSHRRALRPDLASLRIPSPSPPPLSPLRNPVSHATEANRAAAAAEAVVLEEEDENGATAEEGYLPSVGSEDPSAPHPAARAGLGDPVFLLLTFVAVTTSMAFAGMVTVAIPTMLAMKRAANSFSMLADVALEELPSTMAAMRLSGMEISDLTLGFSDLSQDIAGGVTKSAKIVQAVEDGIGQMRDIARQQTTSMIEERANLRTIPTALSAARKSNESSIRQR